MAEFKDLNSLLKYVESEAKKVLKTNVAKVAVETMQKHVEKDVYEVYPNPIEYVRTGDLKRDVQVEIATDDSIIVTNETIHDNKYIPSIIETGVGYSAPPKGYAYEEPRPFVEETFKDLRDNKLALNAMKEGLSAKFKIE